MANKYYNTDITGIIERLAAKYNLPYRTTERICLSQFLFLKRTMESAVKDEADTFKSVRLKKLGLFYPNKAQIKRIVDTKEKYRQRMLNENRDTANQRPVRQQQESAKVA